MSSSVSHSLARVEPAALVPSNIWISSLSLNSIPSSVPGRVHHTSLTGSRSTVNKLLLTQGEKASTMILFPASLQCSSSRECPAASTLSLVLDSSHQSTVPVVQLVGGQSHPRNYPLPFRRRLGKERIQVSSHSFPPLSSQSVPSEPSCIHGQPCCEHPPSPCSAAIGRTS